MLKIDLKSKLWISKKALHIGKHALAHGIIMLPYDGFIDLEMVTIMDITCRCPDHVFIGAHLAKMVLL